MCAWVWTKYLKTYSTLFVVEAKFRRTQEQNDTILKKKILPGVRVDMGGGSDIPV